MYHRSNRRLRTSSIAAFLFMLTALTPASFALDLGFSYTLGGNFTGVINITADDITLDLNGYSVIAPTSGGSYGINTNGHNGVTITSTNGFGTVSGFDTGVGIINSNSATVSNIHCTGCNVGLVERAYSAITITNVVCTYNNAEGFKIRNALAVWLTDCVSQYNHDGFDQNYGWSFYYNYCLASNNTVNGFEVDYANGFAYNNCASYENTENGFSITDQAMSGSLYGCIANNNNHGIHFNNNPSYIYCTGTNASGNVNGIHVEHSSNLSFENCETSANSDGIHFSDTSTYNTFTSCVSSNNTDDGISLENFSSENQFIGCISSNNAGDGLHLRTSSNYNIFDGCTAQNNDGQNRDDKCSGNTYPNCIF